MKIILVQAEIEEALVAYIAQRLTLTPDTEVKIDLSAPRGEGVIATIDLVAGKAEPVEAAPVHRPAVVATRSAAKPTASRSADRDAKTPVPVAPVAVAEIIDVAPVPEDEAPPDAEPETKGEASLLAPSDETIHAPAAELETAMSDAAAETLSYTAPDTEAEAASPKTDAPPPPPAPVKSLFANLKRPDNRGAGQH